MLDATRKSANASTSQIKSDAMPDAAGFELDDDVPAAQLFQLPRPLPALLASLEYEEDEDDDEPGASSAMACDACGRCCQRI